MLRIQSVLFCTALSMFLSCQSQPRPNTGSGRKSKSETDFSHPWLWTTGYTQFEDSIQTSELIRKQEPVYVLQGTEKEARVLAPDQELISVSFNDYQRKYYGKILFLPLDSMRMELKVLVADGLFFFEQGDKWKWFKKGSKPFPFKDEITKLTHTGVTALTRSTGKYLDQKGIDPYLVNILPYFQNSDYVHLSNEVSFLPGCTFTGGTKFCSKEEHFEILKKLKVNVVELTGNHNKDYGPEAFITTYDWYLKQGMKIFGGGRNEEEAGKALILPLKGGGRMAFIGFNEFCPLRECAAGNDNPGAKKYSEEFAKNKILELRTQGVDFIVAGVQFGETDGYKPTASQEKIAKRLVELGADMVYGSQAHVIQRVEIYNNKIIYYGLGNFLFDQIHRRGVREAMFMDHYFYKGRLAGTRHWYTFMQSDRTPALADYSEKRFIQSQIWPGILPAGVK